jgi:hypothetical protein
MKRVGSFSGKDSRVGTITISEAVVPARNSCS